ncbi:MAG: hypothetical protein ACYTHJ_06420 [Planctomycetota bacterium]|jgi:hypothetical protein
MLTTASQLACVLILNLGQADAAQNTAAGSEGNPITLRLLNDWLQPSEQPTLAARITAGDLIALAEGDPLSIQFRNEAYRNETVAALKKVSMQAVVIKLEPYVTGRFPDRFNPATDIIATRIPAEKQATIALDGMTPDSYTGPPEEIMGILLNDITEDEFIAVALRFIQTARQLLDTGNPKYDRTSPEYYQLLAQNVAATMRAAYEQDQATQREAVEVRREVAAMLGLTENADGTYSGDPDWLKESRRFSYIVKDGQFIKRLQPLVDKVNRRMELAGFPAPSSLDTPGIYYDPEIGDVDIVLPASMIGKFLKEADAYERRMAEDAIISIEAVRLTDRDIVAGSVAARLDAQIQGVHDVDRFNSKSIFNELGLNSLLAVANQNLQIRTLTGVAAGSIPDGVSPVQIAAPTLPPINTTRSATTIGTTFAVGADPLFFDGREESYGFSYISPDGHRHILSLEVVDSLRETWNRIERNLIVHKILKTDSLTAFTVPVGPDSKTYEGIAALISQENQTLIVATGTGAISETTATAGTWLVIKDFEITPTPGSSTTVTDDDREETRAKVLLTMFLRDPNFPVERKEEILRTASRESLYAAIERAMDDYASKSVQRGRRSATYQDVFDKRYKVALEETRYTKREENSVISLNFFSSQGNIIQSPGTTQLGDSNDLTSFTTLLRPNVVTPISSFFTKAGSSTLGSAPLRGMDKGEQNQEDKTMTHLVIRARFPTTQREDADRNEGRFVGYFELPIKREPAFEVDMPFLSSSEHPLERLAKLRLGLMFEVLDENKVKKPFERLNPQRFPGTVPRDVHESAMSRILLIQKIIADSPGADENMGTDYGERFIMEVRTLLEYDEHFFDAPNQALRNMTQWNDPERIIIALENSPGRFALKRLVKILDELGEIFIPDDYAENYLGVCPPKKGFKHRAVYDLSDEELVYLRRDVAIHYLRSREIYGDAFLEATSNILRLGTYRSLEIGYLRQMPFRGYQDLVVFDRGGKELGNPTIHDHAHDLFMFIKNGGYDGKMFEKSVNSLEDLNEIDRSVIFRGTDIIEEIK